MKALRLVSVFRWWRYRSVSLLIVAFIILLSFINTYRQRLHDAHEARVLREVNRVQQEEIERFESQTLILKSRLMKWNRWSIPG